MKYALYSKYFMCGIAIVADKLEKYLDFKREYMVKASQLMIFLSIKMLLGL